MNNRLLKANDVAERLNISRSAAFSLMRNGDLPVVRIGHLVRVRPEDLEMYITQNVVMNSKPELKTKPAAVTASLATNLVSPSIKGDHRV